MKSTDSADAFHVGLGSHLLSGMVTGFPRLWSMLGRLESLVLSESLEGLEIDRPVYVTGLARAGTTILLEILASHPDVVTHRYSDFPALFTPYWWGQATANASSAPTERAHGDGLEVTLQSPEAMEEMLWMSQFDHLHDPSRSNVLDETTGNPAFETMYREHIRKLLLLRNGSRYAAKGNYNVTRLLYLQKMFPSAKFLIAIRHPVNHVASLAKQHRLFTNGMKDKPRAVAHLQRVGHFEFGVDRRPINVGDPETLESIQRLWKDGEEIRGWARYWSMLYGWLHHHLQQHPELASSVQWVHYESLCERPCETIQTVLQPLGLWTDQIFEPWDQRISTPSYYRVDFSAEEKATIEQETADVATQFGYRFPQTSSVD